MTDIEKKILFLNSVFEGKTFFYNRFGQYCTIERIDQWGDGGIKVLFVGSGSGHNHACDVFRKKVRSYFGIQDIVMIWGGYYTKKQIEGGF
jgi:hypothetical protein